MNDKRTAFQNGVARAEAFIDERSGSSRIVNLDVGFSPKTVPVGDGTYLHFWYANNAGRGGDNGTIIRSKSAERASTSAGQNDVISKTQTSSWSGKVNFSGSVRSALGL